MLEHAAGALRAGADRLLGREIDCFGFLPFLGLAEVEGGLLFVVEHDVGVEQPAHLVAEAQQRADLAVAQQGFDLVVLELAAGDDLPGAPVAALAGELLVVLLHHAAALRARRLQGDELAGHGVGFVALGALDDLARHLGDLVHEGFAAELAVLHLRQLVFPAAGELRRGQRGDAQAFQQGDQREGLGAGDQLAAFAVDVLLGDQAFDDLRAGRWRAEAAFGHRRTQFLVVHHLAGAFHRRQQRGFVEARWRLGLQRLEQDVLGGHGFALLHRHQLRAAAVLRIFLVIRGFLAIHREPARVDQHLALGLEGLALDAGDAGGDLVFGGRVEHREEALGDQVVDLVFGVGQVLRQRAGGDDGEVVGDLGVVEDALVRLHPALPGDLVGEGRVLVGQGAHHLAHRGEVVLGQGACVGTRVGQHLVLFVQCLCQLQRDACGEAETAVGLALQAGEVEQ